VIPGSDHEQHLRMPAGGLEKRSPWRWFEPGQGYVDDPHPSNRGVSNERAHPSHAGVRVAVWNQPRDRRVTKQDRSDLRAVVVA
jgi:hypothetical protein